MAVEVEEHRFRRAAPDVLQFDPVEPGVDLEIFVHPFEQPAAIFRRTADQPGFIDGQVCHPESNHIADTVKTDHDAGLAPSLTQYGDTTLVRFGQRRAREASE